MTRTMRHVLVGGIIVSSLLLAAGSPAAEKVRLALQLKAGQTYKTRFISDQKVKQKIQGQEVNMNQSIGFVYTFEVQRVDPSGNADCRVRYQSVIFKQDGPQGKTEYDSDHPPTTVPAQAKSFAALVGQGFSLRITPTGRVTEVQGVDAMVDKISQAVDLPNEAARDMMRKQLKEQFGDAAVQSQMEQMLAIYPEKPVAIGDTWSRRLSITAGFPMLLENTYTLRGRKDGLALVDVVTKLSRNPAGKPLKMGPATLSFDLSGTQQGQLSIAEASGWVERSDLKQKFSGTLKMDGAPGMTEPLSWPIEAEVEIRMDSPK